MAEEQSLWRIRLEAARDALIRSRYSFLAVTIVAMAFLIAQFNQSLSWERYISSDPEVKKEFLRNHTIYNSLIGISIDVNDAPVLGALSLFILTMWFFYSMRRENHLIAGLVSDAVAENDEDIMRYVYHGISSFLVFITITQNDYPIYTIESARQTTRSGRVFFIRMTYKILMYLPFLTIMAILIEFYCFYIST